MTRLVRLFMSAIGLIFASVLIAPPANAQVFSFKWGSLGNGDGQFSQPVGIAIDATGDVYISDQDNNRIQKFDMNGNFLRKWGSGGNLMTSSVAHRELESIPRIMSTLLDWGNNRVQKFDSDGNFIGQWGTAGNNDGEFSGPHGIAIDSGDFVYVTDFFSDHGREE